MSREASNQFLAAQVNQTNRNQARNIYYHVKQATGPTANVRWPFELFQNALDAGPRSGRQLVSIHIRCSDSSLFFEHDGAPFTSDELAALLSGGSSKEIDGVETTGRFGTGYLSTHVLSQTVRLIGLLKVGDKIEQFDLNLDRSGDEPAILHNIEQCGESITAANPVSDIRELPSAVFEYPVQDATVISAGVDALKRALPYVYATRPKLGKVVIENEDGSKELWAPGQPTLLDVDGGCTEYRDLKLEQNGTILPERRIHKFMTKHDASSSTMILLERQAQGWKIILPYDGAPRVYREYPLSGSGFLPINLILDGKFDPDEQRRAPLMNDTSKVLILDALSAGLVAVKYALNQDWVDAHWVARVSPPKTSFNTTSGAEQQWWNEQLAEFAQELARQPLIKSSHGFIIADPEGEGEYADFVLPRLLQESACDETTVDRLWPLADRCTELSPPVKELAADWTIIAQGWRDLDLKINLVSVKDLARFVRGADDSEDHAAKASEELKISGARKEWLAQFLDIVGECWKKRQGIDVSVLDGILPDQNQRLCSSENLVRDNGVSDSLKKICSASGHDILGRLFCNELDEIAENAKLEYFTYAIMEAMGDTMSEDEAIEDFLDFLTDKLPANKDCDEQTDAAQKGSLQLISHLWKTKAESGVSIAQKVPIITSDKKAIRWNPNQMLMAPISNWHESARPFANAYPDDRILDEMYMGSEVAQTPNVIVELVTWHMVYSDPLIYEIPPGLTKDRLSILGLGYNSDVTVGNVGNQTFSQIALLQSGVLTHCEAGREEAVALLGLVLTYIAPEDAAWTKQITVNGRKAGKDVEVTVRDSLWVADLRIRAWVPVPGEEGKDGRAVATADTLKSMVNPVWLRDSEASIKLLSECFNFDELELRLLGVEADKLKEFRNGLAKLIKAGGEDPKFYDSLVDQVHAQQARSRDVNKCRKLGIAVQEAIAATISKYGPKLTLIDREFDYEVFAEGNGTIEDVATRLDFGSYLLEVKATTTGAARMTPPQANRASIDIARYVLCVVDLRGMSEEQLDVEWTPAMVEPLAKLVTNIGNKTKETCSLIKDATTKSVGIRNESALRYEVPTPVWESGISIENWAKSLK